MDKASGLTQALDQLKQEIQRENSDLAAKKTALASALAEKQNLENSLRTKGEEIKQKEAEIQKLKTELQQAKGRLPVIDRDIRKLTQEEKEAEAKQRGTHEKLSAMQRQYEEAMGKAGRK